MNNYFELLINDREESAKTLQKPSMRGVQKSVVEKYSEKAHFVYELLQNADDVKASEVSFILDSEGLIFIHNGEVKFNVTNPETEEQDKLKGQLGHINSITSIGHSTKNGYQIGKFGVGFKAVFQYCNEPEIYEDEYKFKIVDFIVPQKIRAEFIKYNRKSDETLFYFPFPADLKEIAFNDISEKIKTLTNPLLYIYNIKNISWKINGQTGNYHKKIVSETQINDILVYDIKQFTKLSTELNPRQQDLLSFCREVEKDNQKYDYTITFFVEKHQIKHDKKFPLYCYFPTLETTNLKFIINAPFELVDNRQSIQKNEWNETLLNHLSQLVADSLSILRDRKLINDDFFNVLPINKSDFEYSYFECFYDSVLNKLQSEENLLPTKEGDFTNYGHNYIFESERLLKLFTSKQLTELLGKQHEVKIIFPTIFGTRKRKTVLDDYVYYNLIENEIDPKDIVDNISKPFIEKQSDNWLKQFYEVFSETRRLWENLRYKPIIRTQENSVVVPFSVNKELQVFLPSKSTLETKRRTISSNVQVENKDIIEVEDEDNTNFQDFPYVKTVFVEDPTSFSFIKNLGIKTPDLISEIEVKILPKYKIEGEINDSLLLEHFEKFYRYFKQCPENEKYSFINKIGRIAFLVVYHPKEKQYYRAEPSNTYLKTKNLQEYFKGYTDIYWFNDSFYEAIIKKYGKQEIDYFLLEAGVNDKPQRQLIDITYDFREKRPDIRLTNKFSRRFYVYDYRIEGLSNFLSDITFQKSILLWNLFTKQFSLSYYFFKGEHKYFYYSTRHEYFEAQFLKTLKGVAWLFDKENEKRKPSEIRKEELATDYEISSEQAKTFIDKLQFKPPEEKEWEKPWTEEEKKEKYEIWQKAKDFSDDDFDKLKQLKNKEKLLKASGEKEPKTKKSKEEISESDIFDLEALKNFSLNLAHIIKYPISQIKNISRTFAPDYPYPKTKEELQNRATEIYTFIQKWEKAINFILSFAPDENIAFSEIDISSIIREIFSSKSEIFEKEEIKTIVELPQKASINYYAEYFEDIIENLIDNSIKALKYVENEKIIKCSGKIEDDKIILLFSDNGVGVDEDFKEYIFEIYKTTTHEEGGTGIGLYIVKTRIESLNGTIELIESEFAPKGATFKIVLPINNE